MNINWFAVGLVLLIPFGIVGVIYLIAFLFSKKPVPIEYAIIMMIAWIVTAIGAGLVF